VSLLRRYSLWVVLAMLACVAGAWLLQAHKVAAYTASAAVDVEGTAIPNTVPATVNMATEKIVASSGDVLALAAPLAGQTPTHLAASLKVTVAAGANVLSIACTMPTAVSAQKCAQAAASAYISFRNESSRGRRVRARDPLHVRLVTPAQVPTKPSGLGSKVLFSLGAFIGLLLGLSTAFVRDRLDDRVRDRDDLEMCLDAAVIGAIPWVRRSAGPGSVFRAAPNSGAAEAYRYLRAHLDALIPRSEDSGKVVLVTGAQPREGRTCIASNLAAVLAQAGHRVLLVDANLRNPSLAGALDADDQPGLTEMLTGRATLAAVMVPTGVPRLHVIGTGTEDQPEELFDAARLAPAFARLRAVADVIIVDSGPVLSVSDPITLALVSDLVLMVASVRRSRRTAIRLAAQELRTGGSVAIAGVLAGVPRSLIRSQTRATQTASPHALPRVRALPAGDRADARTGIPLLRR
jgi:polysaccharide biosynthesis transport protein